MQKYLSPAKRYMSRVMSGTTDIRGFAHKRRVLIYAVSAAILLVTMLGLVVIRGNMNTKHDAYTHEINAKGNSVTTTVTNDPMQISNGMNGGKTSVIVNDQQISVPQNGSVSKTITNEDGSTTHINVSHSSDSSGDSTSSSSSTSTNISTNTYSNNVNLHSP